MSVVDVLETEFNLKGNYDAQMRKNITSTKAFQMESEKINKASFYSGIAAAAVTAGIAIVGVTAALSANAMRDSAQFDSLVKGLEAVEGSAEKARKKIEDIRKIAEAPGIGFEQAVSGYGGLRRGGLGVGLSESLVREAGNANAASGGDVGKFEQIMRAFGQIASKPTLQGDELLQLNEAGLPIQKMLKEAFGTSDTEELKKQGKTTTEILEGLVRVMAKMPRVGGGFQNVMDNMNDAVKRASVQVGDGLNSVLMPGLEKLGQAFTDLSESGKLEELGASLGNLAITSLDAAGGVSGLADSMAVFVEGVHNIGTAIGTAWDTLRDNPVFGALPAISDYLYGGDIRRATGGDPAFNNPAYNEKRNAEAIKKAEAFRDAEAKAKAEAEAKKTDTPAVSVLKKIEANTRVLPEITKTIFGGGELGQLGATAHEIKAQRASRKLAGNIRQVAAVMGVPSARLVQR